MSGKANLGVIFHGFRRGQQHQQRTRAHPFTGLPNEFDADASALVRQAHGEIGQIADVGKVAECACEAD